MQKRTVEIHPYHSDWPVIFQREAETLRNLLGKNLAEIHHIGSTAIKDMPAKPVIDILLEFTDLNDLQMIVSCLQQAAYAELSKNVIPHTSFFTFKETAAIRFHLHIFAAGDPQVRRHVNFRDFMNQHPEEARLYAELKLNLAEKYRDDIGQYVQNKSRLVQSIDAKAKVWSGRRKDFLPQVIGPRADQWTEEKIISAMEANQNVHMTHFAQYINEIELVRIPAYTLIDSALDDDTFNCVIRADFTGIAAAGHIATVTDYFLQNKHPFSWWVSPNDQPADLANYLQEAGYQNTDNNIAMYCDLDAWDGVQDVDSRLRIVRALDKKTLRDFALVLANNPVAFERYFAMVSEVLTEDDPIEFYVGYVDDKPVVRGLSCYYAGVAGLYWLSTIPEQRRQGYGNAMQQFRLKRARDMGYHIAVLQASREGFPLYQRLGYKVCGQFREFKV